MRVYPKGRNKTLLLHAANNDSALLDEILHSAAFTRKESAEKLLLQRNSIGQTPLLAFACSNYPKNTALLKLQIEEYITTLKKLISSESDLKPIVINI